MPGGNQRYPGKLCVEPRHTQTHTHTHTHTQTHTCIQFIHYSRVYGPGLEYTLCEGRHDTHVYNVYTREEPVHRFALVSRPITTHVMLKLLLSTNEIFRQENPYALLL